MYVSLWPEEDVVDLFPDVRSETKQFAIDTMQYGLQIFPLSWILTIKQLQQLETQKYTKKDKLCLMHTDHVQVI